MMLPSHTPVSLYDDRALQNSFDVALQVCLQIPLADVLAYVKLSKVTTLAHFSHSCISYLLRHTSPYRLVIDIFSSLLAPPSARRILLSWKFCFGII